VTLPLIPARGGFSRPFGCAAFVKSFLLGTGPYNSPTIDSNKGAPQADIFYYYKQALRQVTAEERATKQEEKQAKKQKRSISPDNIETLTIKYLEKLPYKSRGCRFHSFVTYFSMLQKLMWVETSGVTEPSEFQEHYSKGQPRILFRL
jgi:hypothetical protein